MTDRLFSPPPELATAARAQNKPNTDRRHQDSMGSFDGTNRRPGLDRHVSRNSASESLLVIPPGWRGMSLTKPLSQIRKTSSSALPKHRSPPQGVSEMAMADPMSMTRTQRMARDGIASASAGAMANLTVRAVLNAFGIPALAAMMLKLTCAHHRLEHCKASQKLWSRRRRAVPRPHGRRPGQQRAQATRARRS